MEMNNCVEENIIDSNESMTDLIKNDYDLITCRLQEIIGKHELSKIISQRSRDAKGISVGPLKIYWGTAPTGKIHIGYMVPLLKIADFLKAGCIVKILFADIHAILDNLKSTPELVNLRSIYYEKMIKSILTNLNVDLDKLQFVRGSSFQKTPEYIMDLYKLSTLVTIHDAKKAGAEVVKQTDNPKLSGLLYPLLQALDEEYLDVDVQYGGSDQRRIMTLASDIFPLLGYKKRIHLMNPMLTAIDAQPPELDKDDNIGETKMSSSNLNSKIDFLDPKSEVKKKINRAYCLEGDLSFNPLMQLMELVIFPLLNNLGTNYFVINRPEKFGGIIIYNNLDQLKEDFKGKKLHPQDLKLGITDCLNNFMEPIRNKFNDIELVQLVKNAYP